MELIAAIQYHENKRPLAITDKSDDQIEYNKLLKSPNETRNEGIIVVHSNSAGISLYEPTSIYRNGNLILHSLLSQNVLSRWFVRLIDTLLRVREERHTSAKPVRLQQPR
jgi:hypothetical protein